MSSTNVVPAVPALKREWLLARIIVIGGFVIAIASAVYFGYVVPRIIQPRELKTALVNRVNTLLSAESQICNMALNSARNFGIVPQYGRLASQKLALTPMQGRYVCLARTSTVNYVLAVDLLCKNLKDPRCTSLYNVTQTDGTLLYQRQR